MGKNFLVLIIVMLLSACTPIVTDSNFYYENKLNDDKNFQELKNNKGDFQNRESEILNVLLIGVDSRGEAVSNSDSIIIAHYNRSDNSLKLASIMRDSYVKIPKYSKKYNKINHAFLLGGEQLLKETIAENFGIKIDNTVVVDFQGFVQVVNLLAPEGIEVNITEAMIDNMKFNLQPGLHKLAGDDLLKYVRFRNDSQSDFGRVKRQQEVLILLKDEVIKQFSKFDGVMKIPKLFSKVSSNVKTDLNWDEITQIVMSILLNPPNEVKSIRIPIANSFTNESVDHAGAILQLNFKENIEALEQFFNDDEMVDKQTSYN